MLWGQHHQPRVEIVGHVRTRTRQRVDAREVPGPLQIVAQPVIQLVRHLVRIALVLLGTIFRELGDCWLGGVPEARAVLIQVGRGTREPPQRVAEHRG